MVICRKTGTQRRIREFEDAVNELVKMGWNVKKIQTFNGLFHLRQTMVAILEPAFSDEDRMNAMRGGSER